MAREMAIAVGSTHPTGMHSCFPKLHKVGNFYIFVFQLKLYFFLNILTYISPFTRK